MNKLHLTKKYFASLWQLSKLAMDDFYIKRFLSNYKLEQKMLMKKKNI